MEVFLKGDRDASGGYLGKGMPFKDSSTFGREVRKEKAGSASSLAVAETDFPRFYRRGDILVGKEGSRFIEKEKMKGGYLPGKGARLGRGNPLRKRTVGRGEDAVRSAQHFILGKAVTGIRTR